MMGPSKLLFSFDTLKDAFKGHIKKNLSCFGTYFFRQLVVATAEVPTSTIVMEKYDKNCHICTIKHTWTHLQLDKKKHTHTKYLFICGKTKYSLSTIKKRGRSFLRRWGMNPPTSRNRLAVKQEMEICFLETLIRRRRQRCHVVDWRKNRQKGGLSQEIYPKSRG